MNENGNIKNRNFIFFIVVLLFGVLSSCERIKTNSQFNTSRSIKSPSEKIFFSLERNDLAMIWSSSINDLYKGQYSFFELYSQPKKNPCWILTTNATTLCQLYFYIENNSDITEKSYSYDISELLLSPDKNEVAWVESYSDCIGNDSILCVGETNLIIRNVDKRSEPRVLVSTPSSHNLRMENFSWSPNGQQIGYVVGNKWEGWWRVRAVDVLNGVITDYGEGEQYKFSPKGNKIAVVSTTDSNKVPGYHENFVRIIAQDGTTLINIRNDWAKINDISWSQDGKKIAIAATLLEGDIADFNDRLNGKGAKIFIANILKNGDITKVLDDSIIQTLGVSLIRLSMSGKKIAAVSLDDVGGIGQTSYIIDVENDNPSHIIGGEEVTRGYNNPIWSPTEDLLAVSTFIKNTSESDGIAIFDPATNSIVSSLSAWIKHDNWNMTDIWKWDSTGDSLLVLIGDSNYLCSREKPQDLGIYHWRENVLDRVIFKIYPTFQQDIKECNTYFIDATW